MVHHFKLKRTARFRLFALFVSMMLVVAMACTEAQAKLLEGILENVDSADGEITIITNDGKTVTLTIASEAPVETEGAFSTIETLEPGASVKVEVDNEGQVVSSINARQAKIKGLIVEIEGDKITVESNTSRRVTVLATDGTRIKLEDDFPGRIEDLRVGLEVELKFDPESRVAFKIDAEEEEAKIEGVVAALDGDGVTIETERGRRLTLLVGDRTRIELEDDFPGTYADLELGVEVEVKFDPFSRAALKIEVEEDEAEVKGVIESLDPASKSFVILSRSGTELELRVNPHTRIDLEDFEGARYSDLRVGDIVESKFNSATRVALKIQVEE